MKKFLSFAIVLALVISPFSLAGGDFARADKSAEFEVAVCDFTIDGQPHSAVAAAAALPAAAAPFDLSETFLLHSKPDSTHKIYLDFTGHITTYKYWTDINGGRPIVTPAYSFDGAPVGSDAVNTNIQIIWQMVAEDYAPFDVDVTTEEPPAEYLTKIGKADNKYGVRCVIGGSNEWQDIGASGVALIGIFSDERTEDIPAFVFSDNLSDGKNAKFIAETAAHEVGHTLGLHHDGKGALEYYYGDNGWAPIMGAGYDQALVQWSRGEYEDATNKEDDLLIISQSIPYRQDDHGDTKAAASPIHGEVAKGIIERNTDVDFFKFTLSVPSVVKIDIVPGIAAKDADLHVYAKLYSSSSDPFAANYNNADPVTFASLGATLSETLEAGTYYLSVEGIGDLPDSNEIYSAYASLGNYTINLDVAAYNHADVAAVEAALGLINWNLIKGANVSQTAVTGNLSLPSTIGDGVSVSWSSDGKITRPRFDKGDLETSVTATLSRGNYSDYVTVEYTVKVGEQTDKDSIEAMMDSLSDYDDYWKAIKGNNTNINMIKTNLTVPTALYGTTVSFKPNGYISAEGVVTRPAQGQGNATVNIVLIISKGSLTATFGFGPDGAGMIWERDDAIGDVNGDGAVNPDDANRLANFLVNPDGYTIVYGNSDVNGDGVIDMRDVTCLARKFDGWPGY